MPKHNVYLICILLSFISLACQGELSQSPGNIQVSLSLDKTNVEILDAIEVGELTNPPAGTDTLRYKFSPADGSTQTQGFINDPRVLRSEFDRAGQLDPHYPVSPIGLLDVRIPALAGTLELIADDGELLGSLDFDPEAPRTQRMELLRQEDVLEGPRKIVDHGPSDQKADILFLPEGYLESELPQFHAHVDAIIAQMSEHPGYRDHWDGFNFWRQDVRSRTQGTGTLGRPVDTAFETASGVTGLERCVFFTNPGGIAAAKRLGDQAGADVTVVLVNTTSYGGCATDGLVVSARPRYVADIISHELGHALFGLADEYDSHRPGGRCSTGPNVAISYRQDALPWADMVNTTEIPTSPNARFGTIGAFEGAGYCAVGRFRPTHNCMMRTLGTGMCAVCKREMGRTMAALAPASEDEAIEVENATGANLWVRCDGPARSNCSDWTFIEPNQTVALMSPDDRFVLHNTEFNASVTFENTRVLATSKDITIYANSVNPLVRPSSAQATTYDVPEGLSPSQAAVLTQPQVALKWRASTSQSTDRVIVEKMSSTGAWSVFHDSEPVGTELSMSLDATSAKYRWRVNRCSSSACLSSPFAYFSTELVAPPEDPPAFTDQVPSKPSGLLPAHESTVTDSLATLKWTGSGTTYNVTVRAADPATGEWVSANDYSSLPTPEVTIALSRGWHAWSVQACNSAGCSAWAEFSLLFRN